MRRGKTIEEVLAEAKGKPLPRPTLIQYAEITVKSIPDMVFVVMICTTIGVVAGAILYFLLAICAFAWELLSKFGDLQIALVHMEIDQKWRDTHIKDAMAGLGLVGACFGIHGAWKRLWDGVKPLAYIRGRF